MSTLGYAVRDSATMFRRDFKHSLRYPMMTVTAVALPVFYLLLFVGVFGNTLRAGLGGAVPAGGHYIDYLAPGVIVLTGCASAEMSAINVSTDMTEGIIARFRTMAIARTSVLTGAVLGGLIRTLISGVLVVAVAVGRNPRASATATTSTPLIRVRMRAPRTWPVSTEVRVMDMVRKRAMMPSFMSVQMLNAVASALAPAVIKKIPGAR